MLNDAVMIGLILSLVFGAVIFYLYNRLSMTERKLGLFEGILTDLKIMMDAAPFASGSDFSFQEPISSEYLNAISGPVPLQENEVEEVDEVADEDYQQTLEQAFENAKVDTTQQTSPYRMLQVDETSTTGGPLISVTKLSPDLDSMTVKELLTLAKQKGVSVPAGTRRKEIIELLKKQTTNTTPPNFEGMQDGVDDVTL